MIFVTVGSEQFPFDRLIRAVDDLARQGVLRDVYCQTGASTYRPQHCQWAPFLPFHEMIERIRASELVIAHGGVGITLLCLQQGKIPVLAPRRPVLGEHVDDHQLRFAIHLEQLNKAVTIREMRELEKAIKKQNELQKAYEGSRKSSSQPQTSSLCSELERLLHAWGAET